MPWRLAALAGIASAVAGLGAAELAAALFAPTAGPIVVVGALVIDLVPGWVKDVVVQLFGTDDKAVLLVTLVVLVLVLAALAGVLELVRSPIGRILVILAGLLGAFAGLTRAGASPLDAAPSVVGMIAAAVLLAVLVKRLQNAPRPGTPEAGIDRRRFLVVAGSATALGILAVIGGQLLAAGSRAVDAARAMFRLPAPAKAAPPIPSGADFRIEGLAPIVTPNESFYRIDTALQVPRIDPADWSLRITGMVDTEVTLGFDELVALPLEESTTTLTCVSNEIGGDLIGNATWLGYPIRELLTRAGVHADADMVLSTSEDGWTASTPIEALTDDRNAILAVGMNGEPLPLEHGFPVRMVVPGLYGYVSATKWVRTLEVTRFDRHVAYWQERGWGERGPIKTASRIDVPKRGQPLTAGTITVAGVAWAQHTGIRGVEVQVDDGAWQAATLADAISADTWRQWRYDWPATSGAHSIRARATDGNGIVQTSAVAGVLPDGATGYPEISVTVGG
ncbi:DMSO/TMAO reductase YedYZ molybdopterin-dependent catalytic subunit [Compostimonas suwonensis]|uniref:DMSO/TMAO reductase YedYZ molybdopterin-dependent catalytic subunit n=1 Tax=Compostimonas suwonensis TaxID=1048394 RepID=A0A2M9BU28_9MICO|nr:DMSO/TMAO reductase YedYZ molybdopterin-dependent catalytic subunit [Compostimonas suwonensis]